MEPALDRYTDILERLTTFGVPFVIHEHPPSITVRDADANLWFPVQQLVKTIAFRIKGNGNIP